LSAVCLIRKILIRVRNDITFLSDYLRFLSLLSFGVKGLVSESFWSLLLGVWGLQKVRQGRRFRLPRSKRGILNFKGIYLLAIYAFVVEIHTR